MTKKECHRDRAQYDGLSSLADQIFCTKGTLDLLVGELRVDSVAVAASIQQNDSNRRLGCSRGGGCSCGCALRRAENNLKISGRVFAVRSRGGQVEVGRRVAFVYCLQVSYYAHVDERENERGREQNDRDERGHVRFAQCGRSVQVAVLDDLAAVVHAVVFRKVIHGRGHNH